jgi:hypothetical protein
MPAPSLGRIVLYREGNGTVERAAIVVGVATKDADDVRDEVVSLDVFLPGGGVVGRDRVLHDEEPDDEKFKPNSWRWPPRVEG